jgi:hypothetical protein
MTIHQKKIRALIEFFAGGAVGSIVGLIAGVSVSPVTSTILGSLSTGLLVLLGFKASKDDAEPHNSLRVLGFGIVCSVCLLAGMYIRTHGLLSPSLNTQDKSLANVFPDASLRQQILLLTNYGMESQRGNLGTANGAIESHGTSQTENKPTLPVVLTKKSESSSAGINNSVLRKGLTDNCAIGRRSNFSSLDAFMKELDRIDPGLKQVIESVPRESQDSLSQKLSQYICH